MHWAFMCPMTAGEGDRNRANVRVEHIARSGAADFGWAPPGERIVPILTTRGRRFDAQGFTEASPQVIAGHTHSQVGRVGSIAHAGSEACSKQRDIEQEKQTHKCWVVRSLIETRRQVWCRGAKACGQPHRSARRFGPEIPGPESP